MAVRVKLRLDPVKGKGGKAVESAALVNSGFETENPEIVLPVGVAQKLGLWPEFPEGTRIEKYEVAGGESLDFYFMESCADARVITDDKETEPVRVDAIVRREKEILMSDKLTSRYKIVIEDVGEGLWRFRDEARIRKSELPEYW